MSEEIPATPFNFAMIYYTNLNSRIMVKDDAYMHNDIYGYYAGLDRIYNLMYFKIAEKKEDEIHLKELDDWFTDSRKALIERKPKKDIMTTLHKIDKKLMVLMHKYNMIFPNIQSVYGMDKIKTRYNIKDGEFNGTE